MFMLYAVSGLLQTVFHPSLQKEIGSEREREGERERESVCVCVFVC